MACQKTVWVNLDPKKVDLTPIVERCKKAGYHCITIDVGVDQQKSVQMALGADAIISIGERWDEAALAQISGKGKILIRYGAGLDNIDVPAATRHNIPVANLPGMNSAAVAEIALLHILNLGRRFAYSIEGVKNGNWPCSIPGNELDGKTLGLVGFGNIARQLVRMVKGFSLKIIAYDPYPTEQSLAFAKEHSVELTKSSEELYKQADIVSLHMPYTPANQGIVNKQCFLLMKQSAYLVNTCRGGVVNEEDLIAALSSKKIRGAGLDVMASEPPCADNPLLKMQNVFVSSHLGALAVESEERSQILMSEIMNAYFSGQVHPNIVNPQTITG
ncbi:MAG: NAD(P)-dependent oxidoreductase [Oscillospiraceae bacterium]